MRVPYADTPRNTREQFQFEMLRVSNHTACRFAEKARFFRSLLGEELRKRLSCGKAGPLCAGRDRRRPQAVPVATKEATGIDSRDKGVPFPPEERFSVDTL